MADNKTESAQNEKVQVIKIHHLRPAAGSKKAKTRVGRGEGSKGKTAGRGTKGTKARKNVPAGFEGGQMPIHMRLPKLRGFKNRFRTEYQPVNLGDIARVFPEGGKVGNEELVAAFNAYAKRFNEENAAAIAAGTVAAVPESSAEFIEKASGIKRRYVVDKAGVLDPARMRPKRSRFSSTLRSR